MKNSMLIATAVAASLTSGIAAADLSGNAAIASNYIWRGVSQTTDQAAGQGGLDWSNDAGLYVGTWVSNVNFANSDDGYEMDVYAGFAGEAGSIGYDVGAISYQYPVTPEFNFTELYVSGSFSLVTVGVNYTVDAASGNDGGAFDSGDLYASASLGFTAGKSDISVYAGTYKFDNDGVGTNGDLDYNHFGASISKDGFTFAADKNDIDGGNADNVRFTVSYGVDFEL